MKKYDCIGNTNIHSINFIRYIKDVIVSSQQEDIYGKLMHFSYISELYYTFR